MTHLHLSVSHFASLCGASVSPQFQVLSPLCGVFSPPRCCCYFFLAAIAGARLDFQVICEGLA